MVVVAILCISKTKQSLFNVLQRETIVKVVPIETTTTFCYAVITRFGRIGVYDSRLQLLDSYVIALSEGNVRERIGDEPGGGGERRRRITTELEQQTDYVQISTDKGVHADCVRQVAYYPDNETVVSCSQDPATTLVIRHVAARKAPYIFKLSRTVPLNFPSFSVLGKLIEFGTRSMYPGPSSGIPERTLTESMSPSHLLEAEAQQWKRGQLLICCCDHIAMLRIVRDRACVTPPPLPPPSREHHASVPSPWTAAEARGAVTPDVSSQENSSRASIVSLSSTSSHSTSARLTSLQGLNVLRAKHELQQQEMKPLVAQCAPHLALKLWDVKDIQFSKDLPMTRRMKDRKLDVSDPEKLVRARLPSTSSFSLPSSTTSSLITPRTIKKL
ncbi:hypothetical protein C0J52_19720 [Blattella germanica]|nr:hypothetical protein C0J52_19720 [Blattella germanica]